MKMLSLEPDEDMKWIYDYQHPEYNSDHARGLRERRDRALRSAPRWMIEEARMNDIMAVTTEINMAMADHLRETGRDAKSIYLGRNQVRDLLRWAHRNGYYTTIDAVVEGKNRPEYNGIKIFEVNDDDHLGDGRKGRSTPL